MDPPIPLQTLAVLASMSITGCTLFSSTPDGRSGPPPQDDTCPLELEASTGTGPGAVPPEPKGAPAPDGGTTVLAMSKVAYGDTNAVGEVCPDGWRQLGLDMDGKFTSQCSRDVCTLLAGATKAIQIDGDNGIDNSFGANVLPIIEVLDSSFSVDADKAIVGGDATMLLQIDGSGADPSYAPLPGALFRAAPSASPRWDGTDVRDVDDVSLVGGSLSQPRAVIPGGYMTQRTWVGAPAAGTAYLDMHLTVSGYPMPPVPIEHVRIVMQVATDGGAATSGTLAGIVRTSDAAAWARRWIYAVGSSSLCSGSAGDAIVYEIEQASDIMADGSNGPDQTCDGISVGLGFDAVAVQLGQARTLPPPPLPSRPYCDAGAGNFDGG